MKRTLGCCYYPEHWPQQMWADDAKRMVESGLSWVRIGEFAWSKIEPQANQLNWDWLDHAIEILGDAGLDIVMGTPTATPPRWLLDKWPDMLAVDANNQIRKFGSRRHYCFSHQPYKAESVRICRLMAERYATNPHIKAWQIDNEYSCHDTTLSYTRAALTEFRHWLEKKYGSITALNHAWGNIFWSMQYNDFSQIELPNLCVTEPNPSHVLDFRRFSSDQVVAYNRAQVDVLRNFTDAPLIHNYMGRITDFDHYDVGADLDIASWDSYPLGFLEDRSEDSDEWKRRFSQQGDPDFQAFHHDLYRSVGKGRWWVMEQQPGPVNWAPFNPAPLPNMVRLWTWEAFAHGAETVSYFRWRQAPFAQEQMHSGLNRPDNVAAIGLNEAKTVAQELKNMPDVEAVNARVAIVFDYQSDWAWQIQPQGATFNYFRLVFEHYRAMRSLGLSIDIISPNSKDLAAYELVLAPGLMTFNTPLTQAINNFQGTFLAGPRSGSKTDNFAINLNPPMPGIQSNISYVESLRPDITLAVSDTAEVKNWLETMDINDDIIISTQCDRPVLIGSNKRYYLTAWLNKPGIMDVLTRLCLQANIPVEQLPEGVRIVESNTQRFIFNYNKVAVKYQNTILQPAEVKWYNI
ncbi:beta-galactosidase [Gammaproteobacteria bacterium AS21]